MSIINSINSPIVERLVPKVENPLVFGQGQAIFLDTNLGNDSNNGLTYDKPKKTWTACETLLNSSNGFPNVCIVKKNSLILGTGNTNGTTTTVNGVINFNKPKEYTIMAEGNIASYDEMPIFRSPYHSVIKAFTKSPNKLRFIGLRLENVGTNGVQLAHNYSMIMYGNNITGEFEFHNCTFQYYTTFNRDNVVYGTTGKDSSGRYIISHTTNNCTFLTAGDHCVNTNSNYAFFLHKKTYTMNVAGRYGQHICQNCLSSEPVGYPFNTNKYNAVGCEILDQEIYGNVLGNFQLDDKKRIIDSPIEDVGIYYGRFPIGAPQKFYVI